MQSKGARAALLAALAAVAVVLFVVLSDGGDDESDSTTATTVTTATTATAPPEPEFEVITLKSGEPVGGVQELEVHQGRPGADRGRLDEPQEDVHIHGYDIEEPIKPSGTVRFDFTAKLDGKFELERTSGPAGRDVVLAEIVVQPVLSRSE